MTYERIVAVFDKAGKAIDAARALEASGFSADHIVVMHRYGINMKELREATLWNKAFGREVTDPESLVFTHAIENGGGILTLRAPETEMDRAISILGYA